jgi:hypothetical protein
MYDANKTQVNTRSGDMHIAAAIFGCFLFKNITTSRMRGMVKGTAAVTYARMKVPIIYKEDDCLGHKEVIDNDPEVV